MNREAESVLSEVVIVSLLPSVGVEGTLAVQLLNATSLLQYMSDNARQHALQHT